MKRVICSFVVFLLVMLGMSVEGQAANGVKQVSLGSYHSAAIMDDGSLWMWGERDHWELGDLTVGDPQKSPKKIMDNVVGISLGSMYSAAVKSDDSLWIWGSNADGRLGNGTIDGGYKPTKLMNQVKNVELGKSHSAAIKKDGSLWMWGTNNIGQLGNGTTDNNRNTPIKIMNDVQSVSLSTFFISRSSFSAAATNDGSIWTWGGNDRGQLGDGTTTHRQTPIRIMDNAKSVSVGGSHSAAISEDGSLWMWGGNDNGELGNGTTADGLTPIKIMDNVKNVSLGEDHSAAIKTDGSLWMWGYNKFGQLGNGTTENLLVPTKIMDNVESVSLGGRHSAAIKDDGSLWIWGNNSFGQLGNGTTIDSSIPIKIMDGSTTDSNPIQYHITLQDTSTTAPLSGVTATYDGQTVSSDEKGNLSLKAGDILYAPITFSKSGYKAKTITVKDLNAYGNNII